MRADTLSHSCMHVHTSTHACTPTRVRTRFPCISEARVAYLESSEIFQRSKGFRGRDGSTTQRLDGEPQGLPLSAHRHAEADGLGVFHYVWAHATQRLDGEPRMPQGGAAFATSLCGS